MVAKKKKIKKERKRKGKDDRMLIKSNLTYLLSISSRPRVPNYAIGRDRGEE